MNQSGVLILQSTKLDSRQLCNLLRLSAKYVQRVLYVDFGLPDPDQHKQKLISPREMYKMLKRIYTTRTKETAAMDIRVLLSSSKGMSGKRLLSYPLDIALLQSSFQTVPGVMESVYNRYTFRNVNKNTLIFLKANESLLEQEKDNQSVTKENEDGHHSMQLYNTCCVGGTFDRIHNGHRLLLSTCCLLSNSKIVVGISADPLLVNKTLGELIDPLEIRRKNVEEYIDDIKPGLVKELVPLYDPAGPTKTDPSIECLIVSTETLNGGNAANEIRKEAGLATMDLFSIDIVEDQDDSLGNNEGKMSSTINRQLDLGRLLKPVEKRPNSITSNVYVIGLTGGIASGKSAIAQRLQKLGAEIIDADLLGHLVYEPGTECYNEILKAFGKGVVSSDNSINRQHLGSIVFNDSEKLKLLCSIVWPKIMLEIRKRIAETERKAESHICVIDAALLIEAGWDELVDEVWVTIIPPSEAVTRMKERNGFTQKQAEKRLHSQITNKERVVRANVVLSTLWEPEVTQKQVEKAWDLLQERIHLTNVKKSPL